MRTSNSPVPLGFLIATGWLSAQDPARSIDLPRQFLDAVVQIHMTVGDTRAGYGSGFFISDTGQVLTCYHVIHEASTLRVYGSGREFKKVTVESIAPRCDL